MIELSKLSLRDLQKEAARAISIISATNHNLSKFNKQANHNSQNWYKSVIQWYIENYGNLPSKEGPGKEVKLLDESFKINDE